MTLGAVLMFGGVSGAQSQDLSGVASGASVVPSFYGVFPSLPQNWSDLPFTLKVSESLAYNSNILNTPTVRGGTLITTFRPIGAFESISTYGFSTKGNWGNQQYFADGSIGLDRYLNHAAFNQVRSSLDAGINWTYTSKCAGRLIASEVTAPSIPGQQIATNVINSETTLSFNETGKCNVSGDWSAIFNSGATRSTNSAAVDKINDNRTVFIAAGMNYSVSQTNSLQLLATVTGTDFTDRQAALNSLGLVSNLTEDQVTLSYTKNFSTYLEVIASIGAVGITNSSFNFGLPSSIEPQYSLSATWYVTPKLELTVSGARAVTPPTNVIGNLQTTENVNVGLHYSLTPKVELSANAQVAHNSSAFGASVSNALQTAFPNLTESNLYSVQLGASYSITPFLLANLTCQYSRTVQPNLVTPTSIVTLSLNYAPY
jgi:hypothetical protein